MNFKGKMSLCIMDLITVIAWSSIHKNTFRMTSAENKVLQETYLLYAIS